MLKRLVLFLKILLLSSVNELFEELGIYFVDPNYQNIISGRTKEENFTLKKTNEKKRCCGKN